jgi:phytoene dehydrogenase-like protein
MPRYAIVGGGIAGIVSALLLARRHDTSVVLLEREPELGGLLRSIDDPMGTAFDYGTHIPRETGIGEIDELLFSDMLEPEWNSFDMQRPGNVFAGTLNDRSPFPDLNRLPVDLRRRAASELLDTAELPSDSATLAAQLEATFGPTIAAHVFSPVLERFYGRTLDELAPDAHSLFFTRVVAFTPEETRRLKQLPRFDAKLAFHSFEEGVAGLRSFYPRIGGVGRWPRDLHRRLLLAGVDVRTEHAVVEVVHEAERVTTLTLDDGTVVGCDRLVWTISPYLLLRAARLAIPERSRPPDLLRTELFHFVMDRPIGTDLHYINCFDPSLVSFRWTLYPNLRAAGDGNHNVTVEVLQPTSEPRRASSAAVIDELKTFGVVDPRSHPLASRTDLVAGGFPVPTPVFKAATVLHRQRVLDALTNVDLVGRGLGRAFFIRDVIVQCFESFVSHPVAL